MRVMIPYRSRERLSEPRDRRYYREGQSQRHARPTLYGVETTNRLQSFALAAAPHAAAVANYCDHVEHNEDVAREQVVGAGEALARLAFEFAAARDLDLIRLYAERLAAAACPSKPPGDMATQPARVSPAAWIALISSAVKRRGCRERSA